VIFLLLKFAKLSKNNKFVGVNVVYNP
jgi:hypothetical protein